MNRFQRKCYEVVRAAVRPGAQVLELSCGAGKILCALKDSGYGVTGTNFSEYGDAPSDLDIRDGVDLRESLPFEDATFDAVLLLDVIEHVSDHTMVIGEIARILRPEGAAVILSPNTSRLSSRVHFLLTGLLKPKRAFIGFDVPPGKAFAFHNYPPHLPTFLYQMHSFGMTLATFDAEWIKPKSIVLWLLLFPWIRFSTFLTIRRGERNLKGTEGGELLLRTLTSFEALCGESWITVHRKRATAADGQEVRTHLPEWQKTRGDNASLAQ